MIAFLAVKSRPTQPMTEKITLTIAQTCERTGLGRSTIYRLFDDGSLPRLKAGKRTLIRVSDLEAYIDSLSEAAS